jgi:hypothetical protein
LRRKGEGEEVEKKRGLKYALTSSIANLHSVRVDRGAYIERHTRVLGQGNSIQSAF